MTIFYDSGSVPESQAVSCRLEMEGNLLSVVAE